MGVAGAIRAGAAYVEAFLDDNRLNRGLTAASARLRGWAGSLGRLGAATRGGELPGPLAAIANFSFSPVGLVAGMLVAVKQWSAAGDELVHLAERAGMSVEAMSALSYAARRVDVDSASLATAIRKMQVTIVQAARGAPAAVAGLEMIGASVQDLAAMSPDQQFKYMADRIAAIQNPTLKAAAAVRIFGRAGTELIPLLNEGAAGIDRFEQRARELGLVTSTESAESAHRFSLALSDLHQVLKKCVSVIGSSLGPYLEELTNQVVTVAVKIRQWIADHRGLLLVLFKVAGAIVLAGAGFSVFGRLLGMLATPLMMLVSGIRMVGTVVSLAGALLATAWSGLVAVFGAVAAAIGFLLSPIGLVIAAALAMSGYFLYASGVAGAALEWLKGVCGELATDAMDAFGAIGDALAAGDIALAAKVLWTLLKMEWKKGVNALTEVWVGLKDIFMSTWTEAVYGIAKIGVKAWGLLQSGWNALTTGLSAAWTIFCDWVKTAWNAASNWVKRTWTTMKEKVGAISPEEANRARAQLEADYNRTKREQAADRERKLAEIGGRFEARQREIGESTRGTLGALEEEKQRKHAEREAAYAKELADAQGEADDARREFDAARAEAAAKRAAMGKEKPGGPGKPGFAPMDLDSMPGSKVSTVGTFNAFAVSGLGLGGGVFQQMKQGIDKLVGIDQKLLAEVQNGGKVGLMLTIYEGFPSRETTTGEKPSIVVRWVILGTDNDVLARQFLAGWTPTVYQNLLRESLHLQQAAPETWECEVKYGTQKDPEKGDWKWEFDTTGATQKITQSKENVGNYAPAGENAPNFGGAIGVTDDSVEGCEITVPQFKWTETHQLDAAVVTWTYSQKVYILTGRTNKKAFRGFLANQVLFLGAKGSRSAKNPDLVEMTFSFAAGPHANNLIVDQITVSSKKAWEYLWLRYGQKLDGYAKKLVKRATSAHVERVYDEGEFDDLGIGN